MIIKWKKIITGAVLFLLIAGSISWYVYEQNQYNKTLIYSVARKFTKKDIRELEARLTEARQSLASVTTKEKKFEWNRKTADIYFELGALKEAKYHYGEAIRIDSDSAPAREDLFKVAVEMKDYRLADKTMLKAISLKPTSNRWKDYIAFRKNIMGDSHEDLDRLYQKSFASTQDDVDMHIAYAKFLEEIGDKEGAKNEWRKAVELKPENREKYELEIKRLESISLSNKILTS